MTGYYTCFGQWSGPAEALVEAIRRENIQYVLMSDYVDLFTAEAASYPLELRVYVHLQQSFPLFYEFAPSAGWSGPRISVLSVN